MRAWIRIQRGITQFADFSSQHLCFPLLVIRSDLLHIFLRLGNLFLPHPVQPRYDILILSLAAPAQILSPYAPVAVDGVVLDGMAHKLEVDADLMGTSGEGMALDNSVVLFLVVVQFPEESLRRFSIRFHAIEPEFGGNGENRLLANLIATTAN